MGAEYGSKLYKPLKGVSVLADQVSTIASTTAAIAENKLGTELLSSGAGKMTGALMTDYVTAPIMDEVVNQGTEAILEVNK